MQCHQDITYKLISIHILEVCAQNHLLLVHVLDSWGCCNKLPQTGWLGTAERHSVTVLEARSLSQGVGRATVPLKPLMGASFLASS